MITCGKCGASNPIATVFCHGCGARVTVTLQQVAGSVAQEAAAHRDHRLYQAGLNALPLCIFALVAALVLRHVAVPDAPPPRIGDPPRIELLADEPDWAAKAAAPATAVAATTAFPDQDDRLAWRDRSAAGLLSAFSLDTGRLQAELRRIAATQKPDGTFPGPDAHASTALATLALQAWPLPETTAGATRARAWLDKEADSVVRQSPLGRALMIAALADAQAVTVERRRALGAMLVDGTAPVWQALALPMLPAGKTERMVALEAKLVSPVARGWLALATGQRPQVPPAELFSEKGRTLATGEDRLLWALVAWFHPVAPEDYADVLREWSAAAPAPVDPALAKACGPQAASLVHLLTLTAPLRMPALQLSR